jgi:hypothetical protein
MRNAPEFLAAFAGMAAAEWQKLVAELRRVFRRKRSHPVGD